MRFSFLARFTTSMLPLLALPKEMEAASECNTTGGGRCAFPFTWNGRSYNECTWDGAFGGERNRRAWCEVELPDYCRSSDRRRDNFQCKPWGDCQEGCPVPGTVWLFNQCLSKSIQHLSSAQNSQQHATENQMERRSVSSLLNLRAEATTSAHGTGH